MTDDANGLPKIDTTVPHSARIWNYWLGGRDHYEVDRDVGRQLEEIFPPISSIARAQRYFLARAIRFLAGDAGVRQFLDIGTGLPTVDNTHEVAQRIAPDARIVYVDNDPLVLVHARALLTSTPPGKCDYIDADLRDPATILQQAAGTLDFSRPVALILAGILGHIRDDGEVRPVVSHLMGALTSGSYLVVADGTNTSEGFNEIQRQYEESGASPYYLRSPGQIERFFDGLQPVDPGVVPLGQWRPDPSPFGPSAEVDACTICGVARKA